MPAVRIASLSLVVLLLTVSGLLASSRFQRGDANRDGNIDISDPIFTLDYLFFGTVTVRCKDAADANGDGAIDIADPISLLQYIFGGRQAPPWPFGECGSDPTKDALDCEEYPLCGDDGPLPLIADSGLGDNDPGANAQDDHNLPTGRQGRGAGNSIRIEGKLFYNDLRSVGHFDFRLDRFGSRGTRVGLDPDPAVTNFLGGLDIVADFFEIDDATGSRCTPRDYLGSATVNYRGEYRATLPVASDPCTGDGNTIPDIGVRFRLRFCNSSSRCFSVEDDDNDTYVGWHPHASPRNPLEVSPGTHSLATVAFQTTPDGRDQHAKAASIYASMVEATRVWHRENPIPWDPRGSGEVFSEFPASESPISARTVSDTRMLYNNDADSWIVGGGPYHEYGHIIHMRAWNGTTGACGSCPGGQYARDGDSTWSPKSREYPNPAFGEGWANFVSHVIRNYPAQACASIDLNSTTRICNADTNEFPDTSSPVTYPNDGEAYARNVAKLLCDWYDDGANNDDDPNMAGTGDHFMASSLYSVWYNLDRMWSFHGGAAGLTICDYMDYYLNGRKSAAAVGTTLHQRYVDLIAELAYNNGLECGLATPESAPSGEQCQRDYLCWDVETFGEFSQRWADRCGKLTFLNELSCLEGSDIDGPALPGEQADCTDPLFHRDCMSRVQVAWGEYQEHNSQ